MRTTTVIGVPVALGGWLEGHEDPVAGMSRAPVELRALGLLDRLEDLNLRNAGDVAVATGHRFDPDPRAKNREAITELLPRVTSRVTVALDDGGADSRLLLLGGECTIQSAAMAGIRAARQGIRLGLVWFDAHGDFHTYDTTPSGAIWGMAFAMANGRGDADLLAAAGGQSVVEEDSALLGGQNLEANEASMLASSRVAHFGPGMLAKDAGMAAFAAWTHVVATRVDAFYIAFDFDALDAAGGWAVTMPEPGGLELETALEAVRTVAAAGPVIGFGAAAMSLGNGDAEKTVAAAAALIMAAFA